MSVEFQNAVPDAFTLPQNVSTSKAILRKTLVEIVPTEQTTYAPGGNNILRFNVSDNMSFLSGPESYFRFNLKRADAVSAYDTRASLEEGGVNALFRSIEVRSLASGILLQRYEHYNRYYAMKSNVMESKEQVNNRGGYDGDFASPINSSVHQASQEGEWLSLSGSAAAATVSTAGVVALLGANGRATHELDLGDEVMLNALDASATHGYYQVVGYVSDITDDETFTITPGINAALVATEVESIYYKKRRIEEPSRQQAVASRSTARVMVFRPDVSILDLQLPLFLMKGGVEIRFELEVGARALVSGLSPESSSATPDYEITNPRMMAMMITPHPDVVSEYTRTWKGEGLLYALPSVRTRRVTGNAADTDISLQSAIGVRSARRVYTVVQDSVIAEGNAGLAWASPSLSLALRDNITSYQYRVGSHEFPHREITCDDVSREALKQLELVSGSKQHRFDFQDWRSYADNKINLAANTTRADMSKKWYMAADLSRDQGLKGALSGTDLSIVPLDIVLERSAAHSATSSNSLNSGAFTGNPIFFHFVEHDAFLKISAAEMSVSN